MQTFAAKAIDFHRCLKYNGTKLPPGIRIMNPFETKAGIGSEALRVTEAFLYKYYNDHEPRTLILGINPGRLGAGLTGIAFTDPKRLISECKLDYTGPITHELSSVFVYEMIHAYGGLKKFYNKFYINSPCPLGFTSVNKLGKEVNYNYYDSPALMKAVKPFIIDSLRKLVQLNVRRDIAYCLGTGKNAKHLLALNQEFHFFNEIIPLEHPRYIMQYKSKEKEIYIQKFIDALK